MKTKSISVDRRTLDEIFKVGRQMEKIGMTGFRSAALENKCIIYRVELITGQMALTADFTRKLPDNCTFNKYVELVESSVKDGINSGLYDSVVKYDC